MSDYTPTADHVRMVYAGINENRGAEFDRWLAAHDRQVKAEALREVSDYLEYRRAKISPAVTDFESGCFCAYSLAKSQIDSHNSGLLHGRSVATQDEPQA